MLPQSQLLVNSNSLCQIEKSLLGITLLLLKREENENTLNEIILTIFNIFIFLFNTYFHACITRKSRCSEFMFIPQQMGKARFLHFHNYIFFSWPGSYSSTLNLGHLKIKERKEEVLCCNSSSSAYQLNNLSPTGQVHLKCKVVLKGGYRFFVWKPRQISDGKRYMKMPCTALHSRLWKF